MFGLVEMVVDNTIHVLVMVTSPLFILYDNQVLYPETQQNCFSLADRYQCDNTEHGDKPWYLEECSATLASAYSSGQQTNGEQRYCIDSSFVILHLNCIISFQSIQLI